MGLSLIVHVFLLIIDQGQFLDNEDEYVIFVVHAQFIFVLLLINVCYLHYMYISLYES